MDSPEVIETPRELTAERLRQDLPDPSSWFVEQDRELHDGGGRAFVLARPLNPAVSVVVCVDLSDGRPWRVCYSLRVGGWSGEAIVSIAEDGAVLLGDRAHWWHRFEGLAREALNETRRELAELGAHEDREGRPRWPFGDLRPGAS